MPTLTSSAIFPVVTLASAQVATNQLVLPAIGYPSGKGRLVHPTLGTFDYEYKPDEWVNIDGDVIIAPTWAASKTLTGMSHALWQGNISDVVCEERWKALGGMAMPVSQLRMLLAIWTTPVDPTTGLYVQWFPNYTTAFGYNVLPLDLVVGSAGSSSLARLSGIGYQVLVFDDVINAIDSDGPFGWIDMPVTFFLKIVGKVGSGGGAPRMNAGGIVTFNVSGILDNTIWWSLWSNFRLPTGVVLPSDAVIQAIYPVIICTYTTTSAESVFPLITYGTDFDPSQLNYASSLSVINFELPNPDSTLPFPLTEFVGSPDPSSRSIGTSLSVLTGQLISARLTANALPTGIWKLTVTAVGYAVCFTSATSSGTGPNESQMPRPSFVPSDQAIAWALPFTATSGDDGSGGHNGSATANPAL